MKTVANFKGICVNSVCSTIYGSLKKLKYCLTLSEHVCHFFLPFIKQFWVNLLAVTNNGIIM